MSSLVECTVSLRCVLPLLRLTGLNVSEIDSLRAEGLSAAAVADHTTRITHLTFTQLLRELVERHGDPALGLRAGEHLAGGDLETFGQIWRASTDLRQATLSGAHYMSLIHGAQQVHLSEQGELAKWELHITDDVEQPPAANDYMLSAAVCMARRYTGRPSAVTAVHFRHDMPAYREEYARVFGNAELKFCMPHNALVFSRSRLDAPIPEGNPLLHAAFGLRAESELKELERPEDFARAVRRFLLQRIASGELSARATAKAFGLSPVSLRRRLAEKSTSHRALLDQVRRELAEQHLANSSMAISDISAALRFSHVSALYKAIRRWHGGRLPSELRARTRTIAEPR